MTPELSWQLAAPRHRSGTRLYAAAWDMPLKSEGRTSSQLPSTYCSLPVSGSRDGAPAWLWRDVSYLSLKLDGSVTVRPSWSLLLFALLFPSAVDSGSIGLSVLYGLRFNKHPLDWCSTLYLRHCKHSHFKVCSDKNIYTVDLLRVLSLTKKIILMFTIIHNHKGFAHIHCPQQIHTFVIPRRLMLMMLWPLTLRPSRTSKFPYIQFNTVSLNSPVALTCIV